MDEKKTCKRSHFSNKVLLSAKKVAVIAPELFPNLITLQYMAKLYFQNMLYSQI